jgi:hypothetical protein
LSEFTSRLPKTKKKRDMKNVEINNNSIYSRNKRIVIITGILLLVLTSPLTLFFDEKNLQIVDILTIIAVNLVFFAWCHYDSLERNETLGAGWRLLIIFLGIFAVFIYLLKTRGFKQGLIAIGKTLLIVFAAIIGTVITTTLVLIIKEAIQN